MRVTLSAKPLRLAGYPRNYIDSERDRRWITILGFASFDLQRLVLTLSIFYCSFFLPVNQETA